MHTPGAINKTYCNSMMLSADVGAGVDPNYQSASDLSKPKVLALNAGTTSSSEL